MLIYFAVGARREELIPGGRESEHFTAESRSFRRLLPVVGFPGDDFLIGASADHALSIWREGDAKDLLVVTGKRRDGVAGGSAEKFGGLVAAGGSDLGTIWTPGYANDPIGVVLDQPFLYTAGDVVDSNRAIGTTGGELFAVATKHRAEGNVSQPAKLLDHVARSRIERLGFARYSRRAPRDG